MGQVHETLEQLTSYPSALENRNEDNARSSISLTIIEYEEESEVTHLLEITQIRDANIMQLKGIISNLIGIICKLFLSFGSLEYASPSHFKLGIIVPHPLTLEQNSSRCRG